MGDIAWSGWHNVHAGGKYAAQVYFTIEGWDTTPYRDCSTYDIKIKFQAHVNSGYVGSSGIMFRYKIDGYTDWSIFHSVIGNGNYGTYRGSKLFVAGTEYYNGSPYFTRNDLIHRINKGDNASSVLIRIDMRYSTDMISLGQYPEQHIWVPIPQRLYYWDINAFKPGSTTEQNAYRFYEYVNNNKVTGLVTNESGSYNYLPKGSYVSVDPIEPVDPKHQFLRVRNPGRNIEKDAYGRYGHYITGYSDDLIIDTTWKYSKLTIDPNGGSWYGNYSRVDVDEPIQYNSPAWGNIHPAERPGYKFLGWSLTKDNEKTLTHNENGIQISNTDMWDASGRCKLYNDTTLYACWKLQNITYVKDNNNNWRPSLVHVKDNNNNWRMAIMYVKDNNGNWRQCGI